MSFFEYTGCFLCVFFFKQKTAYEMRISDWSSDVCSSDLMAYFIVSNTDALGAANGLSILPATGLAMFQFNDKRHYFYVALGLLTITILVTILIRRSRLGFHLSAIRENESAPAALGINVAGHKLLAAAIPSALARPHGTFTAPQLL